MLRIRNGFNADPYPAFYLNADQDPGSKTNADPVPGQTLPSQNLLYEDGGTAPMFLYFLILDLSISQKKLMN